MLEAERRLPPADRIRASVVERTAIVFGMEGSLAHSSSKNHKKNQLDGRQQPH
jgi:hypothetical protein